MYVENIDPYVFRLNGFGVRWYGLFLAISIGLGVWYLALEGQRYRWDEDAVLTSALCGIIGGIVGSRLIFVLVHWSRYADTPGEIIRIDHGGLSWHGALLGGVLAAWLYLRHKDICFPSFVDAMVPGLTLGYALVRMATIFNQHGLGRPAEVLGTRHPAQIYAAVFGLILFLRYFYLQRLQLPAGYQFWSFLWWYTILRVIHESLREVPLFGLRYLNDHWGIGFTTLAHLVTPLLLGVAWYFMNHYKQQST